MSSKLLEKLKKKQGKDNSGGSDHKPKKEKEASKKRNVSE